MVLSAVPDFSWSFPLSTFGETVSTLEKTVGSLGFSKVLTVFSADGAVVRRL